ncbi:MAG: tape measure protein, partial [Dehalococcoidia bacterium]|nr:tape measure protein [Dehalococcoidia bacterium]
MASAGRAITATNNAAASAARNATAYNNLSISAARLVTANNAVAISASRVITAQNTAAASASRAAIAAANAGIASQLAAARLATAQANAAMATNRLNESLQSSRTALANLGNQAQTTSRHMGGMLSMVKGVLVAMAVFEVMRIPPMLISTAVQAYAEYERLGLTLKNLLSVELMQADASLLMRDAMGQVGEKSKELIDWTEKLAILSPFTQETVAYTLQTLMGYGMASDMAQKLTQGLADYAAGTGRSEEQTKLLGLALGQVWAKGKLTGEEMRQLTNAGMGVELMATAAGMSLETFTDVMKEGEMDARKLIPRLIELTDERFAGAAKAQATSWAGLLSTMQDITKIGLQTFFTETLQGIQPYLADFLDAWPQFKENLASAGREFADFGANSVRILGELKDKWTDMGTEGQNQIIIVATLIAAPGALGIAIRSAQGALAILGFAFTGLLGKVTLVIGAVMALGTVLRKAAEPTLTWGEAFEKTWGPALQEVGASSKRAALELQKMMDPNSSAGMQIALQDTTEQIEKQIVKVDDLQVALIKVGQVAKIRPDFQVDISRNPLVQMFRPAAEALRILNEEYDQEKAKLDDLRLSAKNVAAALKTSTDGAFDLGRAMKYAADMGIPLAEAIQKALSHKTIEMPGMEELAKAWIQVNGETELMFASTDALIRNYERLNNVSIKVAGSQATIGSAARSTYPPLVVVGDATKAAGKAAEDAAAQYEKMIESMRNIIASSSDIITYLISIDPAAMAAAAAVDTLRLRLVGLQDQQAGLQESIKASQAVLRAMQDTVSRLGDALAAAKSKLADLAAPKLKGMGELDDQMAAIERQLNRLKMVDLMIPSLADIKNQFKDLARVTTE